MGRNVNDLDILVNGIPLKSYGGSSLLDYSIGETPMDNRIIQGVNRTAWDNVASYFGLREISLTIIFTGATLHEAKMQRSIFNGQIYRQAELYIPDDGFYYTCSTVSLGAEELIGIGEREAKIKATCRFKGIRHGQKVTETIPGYGAIINPATMPWTDCKLTATVATTGTNFRLWRSTWASVTAGDVLVFDGIDKQIKRNGVNDMANVTFINFPHLSPGRNVIAADADVTVEYYPAYI